jgi:hypothetical protein
MTMILRVILEDGPADPQPPAPTWQQQLYPGLYPESVAEQAELFPGFQGPAPTRPRKPDPPGQGQLFE